MILPLPLLKVERLKEAIVDGLDSERACVRNRARIVGYLISVTNFLRSDN